MVDLRKVNLGENLNVAIKAGGNLHVQHWDEETVGVMSYHDEFIRIEKDENSTRVLCSSDCDVFLPGSAILKVEKVGGDAYLRDIQTKLLIQKVGGDLTIQNVPSVEIDRIGGDCRIKNIHERMIVHRMSGDLSASDISGYIQVETVRGDVRMAGCKGELSVQGYGDMRLEITEVTSNNVELRTKGDLHLHLGPAVDAALVIETPSRDIEISLNGKRENISAKNYTLNIGSGKNRAMIYASGDVVISDTPLNLTYLDHLFDRIDSHWERVEHNGERRFDHTLWGEDASFRTQMSTERSVERARKAAERIERRAQKKVKLIARLEEEMPDIEETIRSRVEMEMPDIERKINDAMRSAFGESEVNFRDRDRNAWMPPVPPIPPISVKTPIQNTEHAQVSDSERKMILQMVHDGKITPEQAVELLKAITGE